MSKSSSKSSTTLKPMSAQEKSIVDRLQSLGMSQADAVELAMNRASQEPSLVGLQGSDKELLDQAFSGAEENLRRQAHLIGQDLAGTRGLNPSDTPVSEAVLREILPALSSLNSQRASQSLGLGLNLQQLRQQGIQNLLFGAQSQPSTLTGLAQRFQNERFATAKTKNTNRPSLMSSIGQGLDLVSKVGSMGGAAFAPGASGAMGAGGASSSMTPGLSSNFNNFGVGY